MRGLCLRGMLAFAKKMANRAANRFASIGKTNNASKASHQNSTLGVLMTGCSNSRLMWLKFVALRFQCKYVSY